MPKSKPKFAFLHKSMVSDGFNIASILMSVEATGRVHSQKADSLVKVSQFCLLYLGLFVHTWNWSEEKSIAYYIFIIILFYLYYFFYF